MACTEDYDFLSKLITLVQQNKLLYEKKDAFYFNRLKKEKAWADIAQETNRTASECKIKWIQLREKFGRELRKEDRPSGSGGCEETEWALFSELLFLRDSMKPRRTRCNEMLEYVTDSNSASPGEYSGENSGLEQTFIEESSQSFTTSTPAKRRKVGIGDLCDRFGSAIGRIEERFATAVPVLPAATDDSDELFMRTVISMMKDLPSVAKDDLKEQFILKVFEARRQYQA